MFVLNKRVWSALFGLKLMFDFEERTPQYSNREVSINGDLIN